jgi:hypothetical protein
VALNCAAIPNETIKAKFQLNGNVHSLPLATANSFANGPAFVDPDPPPFDNAPPFNDAPFDDAPSFDDGDIRSATKKPKTETQK